MTASLSLSGNTLSGEIPASFGDLTSLKELNMENNELSGDFPTALSGMTSIKSILLAGNSIVGRVSSEVCDLRNMDLETFVTDCRGTDGRTVTGVLCQTSSCCTACVEQGVNGFILKISCKGTLTDPYLCIVMFSCNSD